jgi:hypothetical protein
VAKRMKLRYDLRREQEVRGSCLGIIIGENKRWETEGQRCGWHT